MQPNRTFKGSYIQGQFVKIKDPNGEISSRNPGDLDQPGVAVTFSYEHVHDAVAAAKQSFASWRRLRPADRVQQLQQYRRLLESRKADLAAHISFEIGKPLWEARQEIQECLALIDYHLKQGIETTVEIKVPHTTPDSQGVVRFMPRGVVAVISQAILPALGPHSHFIPALLNGNTVVLKSSKHSPFVGQCLAEVVHDSGIPAGVFNVVHGDAEVARRLTTDSGIDAIFFTGSHETGGKILKQVLSDYWKVVVLETGGKNGLVVWDDCHYQKALSEALLSAFLSTGQRSTSASRILVHDAIFEKFLNDFHGLSKKCRIGLGSQEGENAPFMGPLTNEGAMEGYLRYQGIAVREGCEEIMRGKTLERDERGYYVSPSIHVVHNPDTKSVYQKNEVYGPNVAFYRVKDLDEVAEVLNATQYGLVASIYTGARENYVRLAEEVRVGLFHWNRPTTEMSYQLPFAGIRRSGNHRPMGSFAAYQCTYPMSSLEHTGAKSIASLPEALPKVSE